MGKKMRQGEASLACKRLVGKTCRTTAAAVGVADNGSEFEIRIGSVVQVVRAELLADPSPGDDGSRLTVTLLTETGAEDPRKVSYEGAFPETLAIEPGIIDWTPEDEAQAFSQGWGIFYCDGSEGPLWQLQVLDEDFTDRFKSDSSNAWDHVWERATEWSDPVCQRALAFLYARAPEEYAEIRKHCLRDRKDD